MVRMTWLHQFATCKILPSLFKWTSIMLTENITNPQNKLIPVLVILLIVASFFIGSLYTKVNLLEKGVGTATTTGAAAGANQPQPPPPVAAPVDIALAADDNILGDKNAKVTLVEFTDYQCPFCGQLFTNTFPQIKKDYIDTGKIRYVVRDFPLNAIHPMAQKAAEASHCAKDQNKFWELHDKMFGNQTALTVDDLKKYAGELSLNSGTFASCLDSNKYAQKVKDSTSQGEKFGVRGTPSTFVGKSDGQNAKGATEVSGAQPFDAFKTAIEAVLAG